MYIDKIGVMENNQSNLNDIVIDLTFTKGMPVDYFEYHGHPPESSYAILWCMLATGFNRIFTRDDMKEFLFRLAITLNSLNLVETWLMKDHLMDYRVKGNNYILKLEDIAMHFGIEIIDSLENHSTREKYLSDISTGIKKTMFISIFSDFSVLEPIREGDEISFRNAAELAPQVTPELLAKAEFFAGDLMKFISEETFTDRNPLMAEKEKEIETRRERVRNLPVFDIKKIPRKIIRDWVESKYKPEYAKEFLKNKKEFERYVRPFIYLAWLMAHDLLIMNGPFTYEKEGVDLNYEDYELPDGGFRLDMTIEEYELEDLANTIRLYLL
jgi:hypothetical protein